MSEVSRRGVLKAGAVLGAAMGAGVLTPTTAKAADAPKTTHQHIKLGKQKNGQHEHTFNLEGGDKDHPNEILVRVQEMNVIGSAIVRVGSVCMQPDGNNRKCRIVYSVEKAPGDGTDIEAFVLMFNW